MQTPSLAQMKIAFLATDGFEQVELTRPWAALEQAGATVALVSPREGRIQGMHHSDKGASFPVHARVAKAHADEYDALVLPGGVANPDALRLDREAVEFVRSFFLSGKPVAAICHAPWMLVEADVVRGRTLTSWPSLQTDVRNAGGQWVDQEVHVDRNLVTSRKPDDLEAFCSTMIAEFARARVARRTGSRA